MSSNGRRQWDDGGSVAVESVFKADLVTGAVAWPPNQSAKAVYKCQGRCHGKLAAPQVFGLGAYLVSGGRRICKDPGSLCAVLKGCARKRWTQSPQRGATTQTTKVGDCKENPFGDRWLEPIFCRTYVEATKEPTTDLKRRKDASLCWAPARWTSTKASQKYRIAPSEVQPRRAKKEDLEDEDLPAWTKKTLAKIWNQVSEDHEAGSASCGRARLWDLRHLVGEAEEKGTITFTNVCENCKNFLVEDFLWWATAKKHNSVSGWLSGA